MKTLVVYYSRTGVTRTVARGIAEGLSADVEELIDTKSRGGAIGFARSVKDALKKTIVPIEPPKYHAGDYDLVVIGTPVWANTMSSAVRCYLTEHAHDIRQGAMFCTTHSSGVESTFEDMRTLLGKPSLATAGFRQKQVKRAEHIVAVDAFLSALKAPADNPS